METLQKASHKLAEEIYKATAQQPGAGAQGEQDAQGGSDGTGPQAENINPQGNDQGHHGPSSGPGKNDDVIDADFKVKDDK